MAKSDIKLGGWSIPEFLAEFIEKNVPKGSTILELGSGAGTQRLAENYKMISIEHNPRWLDQYDSTYIHAPIVHYDKYSWYDRDVLFKKLNGVTYNALLVDGPPAKYGRRGVLENLWLFDLSCMVIFDDLQRPEERELWMDFCLTVGGNRRSQVYEGGGRSRKQFGVIFPKK